MELHDTPTSKLAEIKAISPMILQIHICKMSEFWWITYMLSLVDSFSNELLAFLWEQTVPHYWLTCFSIPMRMSF